MELKEFLYKAKKAAIDYETTDSESDEFSIRKGELDYVHKNIGGRVVETVSHKKLVVWTMASHPAILTEDINKKIFYVFLRRALNKMPCESPLRGPDFFRDSEWEYTNHLWGKVDRSFDGVERVTFDNLEIFSNPYKGGIIR